MKLDIVDGTVSVTKCIGKLLEVHGAISIALFQYPFCLKYDSEQCHRAKLVIKWKCQNNFRTLTLPAHAQDMNPIENLWCKVALEII